MKEEEIKGSNLKTVDKADIKGWGIKNYDDKQKLYEFIHGLTETDKYEGQTPYL